MTKRDLLAYLADVGDAEAQEVADAFGLPYAAAAMALLRCVRQGLVNRAVISESGAYRYNLVERGHARLAYFDGEDAERLTATQQRHRPRPTNGHQSQHRHRTHGQGDSIMKRKKLHTGAYHCPACFVEFDLFGEESLRCDQCQGPLAKGSLDEVWADDESDDE